MFCVCLFDFSFVFHTYYHYLHVFTYLYSLSRVSGLRCVFYVFRYLLLLSQLLHNISYTFLICYSFWTYFMYFFAFLKFFLECCSQSLAKLLKYKKTCKIIRFGPRSDGFGRRSDALGRRSDVARTDLGLARTRSDVARTRSDGFGSKAIQVTKSSKIRQNRWKYVK